MARFLFSLFLWASTSLFAQNELPLASTEINNFLHSFDVAWNTHNTKALMSLWSTQGDFMTPQGRWIMNPTQLEKHFESGKLGFYGKSTISQSLDAARLLNLELVIVDSTVRLNKGDKNDPLNSILQHAVYILIKNKEQWKILSLRMYQFQPQSVE
ncbi:MULTISPECIES: hypothetical protein [unclassified Neochlamydia]|uniref:YybH family protein n=1 Tax=unclassified Neochlamydia TaxID=2643326 RepID=UPI00140DB21C|nr:MULTISPECIES: hypothetical protein [unclassified Neochlamydia]MBS4170779.1 Uncharacterized protein [Neochlamydia sp. AcF95]NGY95718.1 hypothetical protein [Neochlamydia sp. AcF84]